MLLIVITLHYCVWSIALLTEYDFILIGLTDNADSEVNYFIWSSSNVHREFWITATTVEFRCFLTFLPSFSVVKEPKPSSN